MAAARPQVALSGQVSGKVSGQVSGQARMSVR